MRIPRLLVAPLALTGTLWAAGTTAAAPLHRPVRAASSAPAEPPVPGPWHLVFDGAFGGDRLDAGQWSTGWFGSGVTQPVQQEELECYSPSQVTVSGGALHLSLVPRSESCGGVRRPYDSGIVTTDGKFSFTYGFVQARIYLPGSGTGTADWPAFWADGQVWPQDGEMDIMEGLAMGDACWHFVSPAGNPGGCPAGKDFAGWHTYAADWEPGSVTYYYDGSEVGRVATGITASPMYLILDLAIDNGANGGPKVAPAQMLVDYVRVWQH